MISLRPHDQINEGGSLQHGLTFGLGDTAGDTDGQISTALSPGITQLPKPPELGIDLFRRFLADVTGIQDHQIGIFRTIHRGIAVARQKRGHAIAVIDIHLTAIGLNEELLGHASTTADIRKIGRNHKGTMH